MHSHINFGYSWYWTYGHLLATAIVLPLFWLGIARKWPKLLVAILGAVTLWSVVAFLAVRFGVNMNGRMPLPTESFLPSGSGRVLDMGAGTGRSTVSARNTCATSATRRTESKCPIKAAKVCSKT